MLPVDREVDTLLLVGVIMSIRNLIPLLSDQHSKSEGMKGSFGETKHAKTELVTTEQMITVGTNLLYYNSTYV